jgi:PPOX class probable F420-dependent enzyme
MPPQIPTELRNQKYISLAAYRKTGVPVRTPVWFAEENGKLYIFTNPASGKLKRIRNNPAVRFAPCTIRGRVTGTEFAGQARLLGSDTAVAARRLLEKKYWLMKVPFLWSKDSVFLEIELT